MHIRQHVHSLNTLHATHQQERGRKRKGNKTMSLQFSAGGEGEEEEEEELETGAVLAAAAVAAQQWEESLEHLKQELSQCDEETKVRGGAGRRKREEKKRGCKREGQAGKGGGKRASKQGY